MQKTNVAMMKKEWHIKIIHGIVTEISKTKCSEGRVICLTLLAIRVCVFVEKLQWQSAYQVKDFSI